MNHQNIITEEKHNCLNYRIFLDQCQECLEKDQKCPLSEKGICSFCGEVIN